MRGRFSGKGWRPGCGLRSRGALGEWFAARFGLYFLARDARLFSASNSSCKSLSVSLCGPNI